MKRAAIAIALLACARAAADPPAPACAFSGGLYAGASGWAGAIRSRRVVTNTQTDFVSTQIKLEGDAIGRLEVGFELRFCNGDIPGAAVRLGGEVDRITLGREVQLGGTDIEGNVPIGNGAWRVGLRAAYVDGSSVNLEHDVFFGGVRARYDLLTLDVSALHAGYGDAGGDWGVFVGLGVDGVLLARL